jgi:nitrogen fixation-related uncharacterized protein
MAATTVMSLVIIAVLLCLGGALVLFWAVETEQDDRPVMQREAGERTARQDTDDHEREH